MKPWLWLLGGGVVGLGLYEIFHKPPPKYKGDLAQVGDNVRVSIATLPPGSLPQVIPQVGLLDVKVDSADQASVSGQITGYYLNETAPPAPVAAGPGVQIPRNLIVTVMRGGRVIA